MINKDLKEETEYIKELKEEYEKLISELDTFKLAFYTLWKCCNSNDIPTDIGDTDTYMEFRCGYESLYIPVSIQELESIEKACELLDIYVREESK